MIGRSRLKKTRYLGSSCSGTDGDVNRTLAHTRSLLSDSLIYINGRMMHEIDEYSVSGATITFLGQTYNADIIVVVAYNENDKQNNPDNIPFCNLVFVSYGCRF